MPQTDVFQYLLDQAVLDIGRKLAQIELFPTEDDDRFDENHHTLQLSTTLRANPPAKLLLQGDLTLFEEIAKKMKRNTPADLEETMEYIKEFFNIVYGNAISSYNRNTKNSVCLGLSEWLQSLPNMNEYPYAFAPERFYRSPLGCMRIFCVQQTKK